MNNAIRVTLDALSGVTVGLSAKKDILGKAVYNDQDDKVGEVVDILIAPDKSATYGIVGVGGFLGMGEHYVAVPIDLFQINSDDRFVLIGATKELLKDAPAFQYDTY